MRAERRPVVLVTGGSGQVGYEVVRLLAPLGDVIAPDRDALDLARPAALRAKVRELQPRAIVNAAAYTAVDRAEADAARCAAINAEAPGALAEVAREVGAALVHYSTDYVFDGTKGAPYTETDAPNPLNVYGATKLAGERAIEAVGGAALVLRTSWVYGTRGANFLRTVRRLARERDELRIVDDQVGAPTWSRSIALATVLLLRDVLSTTRPATELLGDGAAIYHLSAAGATSWCGFARAILEEDPTRGEHRCRELRAISTADYPTAARRPAYSVLDCSRLAARFAIALPPWRDQLRLVLGELAS